jgi:hypothetical protein
MDTSIQGLIQVIQKLERNRISYSLGGSGLLFILGLTDLSRLGYND